ncbi:Glucoamylase S1/S2 [Giardia muris]|uniref:Glucoamylase S1/S2 n=1 Tax=Giardia muris TaxID=5742 RepID=A0A4Z1SSY3_GIAMU|nr:Glucoamylase S1/S2 [Giardia muris]|eukprot:TNJ28870.1 Glucoamylase S1/S2 [Giardia muris]
MDDFGDFDFGGFGDDDGFGASSTKGKGTGGFSPENLDSWLGSTLEPKPSAPPSVSLPPPTDPKGEDIDLSDFFKDSPREVPAAPSLALEPPPPSIPPVIEEDGFDDDFGISAPPPPMRVVESDRKITSTIPAPPQPILDGSKQISPSKPPPPALYTEPRQYSKDAPTPRENFNFSFGASPSEGRESVPEGDVLEIRDPIPQDNTELIEQLLRGLEDRLGSTEARNLASFKKQLLDEMRTLLPTMSEGASHDSNVGLTDQALAQLQKAVQDISERLRQQLEREREREREVVPTNESQLSMDEIARITEEKLQSLSNGLLAELRLLKQKLASPRGEQERGHRPEEIRETLEALMDSRLSSLMARLPERSEISKGLNAMTMQVNGLQQELAILKAENQRLTEVSINANSSTELIGLRVAVENAEKRATEAERRYSSELRTINELRAQAAQMRREAEQKQQQAEEAHRSAILREAKAKDLEDELNRLLEAVHERERAVLAKESEVRRNEAMLRERRIELETEGLRLETRKRDIGEAEQRLSALRQESMFEREKLVREQISLANQLSGIPASQMMSLPPQVHMSHGVPNNHTIPIQFTQPIPSAPLVPNTPAVYERHRRSKSAAREELERAQHNADRVLKASQLAHDSRSSSASDSVHNQPLSASAAMAGVIYDAQSHGNVVESLRTAKDIIRKRGLEQTVNIFPPPHQQVHQQAQQQQQQVLSSTRVPVSTYTTRSQTGSTTSGASTDLRVSQVDYSTHAPPHNIRPTYNVQELAPSRAPSQLSDNVSLQMRAINRAFTPLQFDKSRYTPTDYVSLAPLAPVTPIQESRIQHTLARREPSSSSSTMAPLAPLLSGDPTPDANYTAPTQLTVHTEPSVALSRSSSVVLAPVTDPVVTQIHYPQDSNKRESNAPSYLEANMPLSTDGSSSSAPQGPISVIVNAQHDTQIPQGNTSQDLPKLSACFGDQSMSASAPTRRPDPMTITNPSMSGSISAVPGIKTQIVEVASSDIYSASQAVGRPDIVPVLSETTTSKMNMSHPNYDQFYEFSSQPPSNEYQDILGTNPFAEFNYEGGRFGGSSSHGSHSASTIFPF